MDSKEFNAIAVRTETDVVTFDVRPFGEKQGEAIDSYLHDVGMAVQMGVFRHTKPIVLECDSTVIFPTTTETWLAAVHRQGVNVQIRTV